MMTTALINDTNLVPRQHLSPILVRYVDETRRLDPRLTIHLNWNALIPNDRDFNRSTLKRETAPLNL